MEAQAGTGTVLRSQAVVRCSRPPMVPNGKGEACLWPSFEQWLSNEYR